MRLCAALATALATTAASAGSIVEWPALPAEEASGGVIAETVSPSMIALGEPAVSDEEVASVFDEEVVSVEPEPPFRREDVPMVIRGGIVGDPFSTPVPSAPEEGDEIAEGEAARPPLQARSPVPPVPPAPPSPADSPSEPVAPLLQ